MQQPAGLTQSIPENSSEKSFIVRLIHFLIPPNVSFWLLWIIATACLAVGFVDVLPKAADAKFAINEESPIAIIDSSHWLSATRRDAIWYGPLQIKNVSGSKKHSVLNGSQIAGLQVSPNGKMVAVVEASKSELHWIDVDSGNVRSASIGVDFAIESAVLAWGGNGTLAIDLRGAPGFNRAMVVSADGSKMSILPGAAGPFQFSPDGSFLASVDSSSIKVKVPKIRSDDKPHKVMLWNLAEGNLVKELSGFAGKPQFLHFSPNGEKLAYVGRYMPRNWTKEAPETFTWETASGKRVDSFPVVAFPDNETRVIWFTGQPKRRQHGMDNYFTWLTGDLKSGSEQNSQRFWPRDEKEMYLSIQRTTNAIGFIGESTVNSSLGWAERLPPKYQDILRKWLGLEQRERTSVNVLDIATRQSLFQAPLETDQWQMLVSPANDAVGLVSTDGKEFLFYRIPASKRWGMAALIGLPIAYLVCRIFWGLSLLMGLGALQFFRRSTVM